MQSALVPSLLSTLLAVHAAAQQAPGSVRPIATGRLSGVLVDQPGDGNVWVLTPGYKARFGADGVEFIPYFGAKAPRNFPLGLRLSGARVGARPILGTDRCAPVVEGATVTYARDGLREVWELRPGEAEQTFVLADCPRGGDLVLTLDTSTELAGEETTDGLRFHARGLGEVRFGTVTTIDAAGRRVTTAPRFEGGRIELRVPAAFLAAATGPLRIDPVVRAISIDAGNDDTLDPDVAYEPNSDRWLVVYTRVFSALDQDIISRRYSGEGNLIEELAVATGSRESLHASVAASSATGQFLVAWDEDRTLDRIVLARTRTATNTTMGSTLTVMDSAGAENSSPSVGGSNSTDAFAGTFLVACREAGSAGEAVVAIRMTSGGTQSTSLAITAFEPKVDDPGVLKSRQSGQPWLVACSSTTGVRVAGITAASGPAVGIAIPGTAGAHFPRVAGQDSGYLLVCQQAFGGTGTDIVGFVLKLSGTTLTQGLALNLTLAEPGTVAANGQLGPAISFDGVRYTYAYRETVGSSGNSDVFAAAVKVGASAAFSEAHRALHTSTAAPEAAIAMAGAAEMGGEVARSLVVWDRDNGSEHDVICALYDGVRSPGGVTSVNTHCGSVPFNLVAENTPALGATLRLRADPLIPSSQVFLFGPPIAPLQICSQGCKLGLAPILFTVAGRAVDLPIPVSLSVLGAALATQNVLVANLGGCALPTFPIAMITTDTLVVTVQ